jgi:hypothetical protein
MRLILGTIGIGLAVTVLLLSASVGNMMSARDGRSLASSPNLAPTGSVHPLQFVQIDTSFQGESILGGYLHATGPDSPIPPGLTSIPGPNQIALSPGLASLLSSDAGRNLRPRFPQRVVGTIGEAGLRGPADLQFYAGTTAVPSSGADAANVQNVYSFGGRTDSSPVDPTLVVLAIIGAVALLIPILIFVAVSSRIAGAERDRRLAALRLVGAGGWQVRRIAAAESLVSAGTGLILGALVFLAARALAPDVDLLGWSAFSDDITPPWPLVVLIVLFVPVLTVGTVLISMRRTIIEPLGVVRGGRPVRRRLWWRLALVVIGVGTLFAGKPGAAHDSGPWIAFIAVGASALLIGVPVLLPWLLERVIGRMRGGAPSWQLAIRRLQLDSGTPARVVGGVAVVLAGAIALQLMLFAAANRFNVPATSATANTGWMAVSSSTAAGPKVVAALAKVPAAKEVDLLERSDGTLKGVATSDPNSFDYEITVASCAMITEYFQGAHCVDGDAFNVQGQDDMDNVKPGMVLELTAAHDPSLMGESSTPPAIAGTYPVPANLTPLPDTGPSGGGPYIGDGVLLTPAAAAKADLPADLDTETYVRTDPGQLDAADQVANALGSLTWQVDVQSLSSAENLNADQKTFVSIRNVLLGGSLFTLLLAGVSMLVLALEQVRERRRPLAVLAAAGVPRSALSRSLLWQTAVPVVLGVLVAVGTGIGLAALVIRITSLHLMLDWTTIGIFAAAALVLVLLVTAATLPALRGAMRLSALRTE